MQQEITKIIQIKDYLRYKLNEKFNLDIKNDLDYDIFNEK